MLLPDYEKQNQAHIHEVTVFGQAYQVADYGSHKVMEHTVEQRRSFCKPIKKLNDKTLAQYIADCLVELEKIEAQRLLIEQRTDTNLGDLQDIEESLDIASSLITPGQASLMTRSLDRRVFVVAWLKNVAVDEQKKRAANKAMAEAQAELDSAIRKLGPAHRALGGYIAKAQEVGVTPDGVVVKTYNNLAELMS